jgi:hypothetical protein
VEAEPYAGTTVHAYLLNNYWHTNYKADQQGPLRFRFILRPHGAEPPGRSRLSRDLEQPLAAVLAGAHPAARRCRSRPARARRSSGCVLAGEGRAVSLSPERQRRAAARAVG